MKKKVLIAEDDFAIREALSLVLTNAGYSCEVTDGSDELVPLITPDIGMVILDIRMSGVDGRDVCRSIKENPDTSHIPVLMLSALGNGAQLARACGADDFLGKPFEIPDLLRKVKEYSDKNSQQERSNFDVSECSLAVT